MMSAEQIKTTFSPAMDEIIERCSVSEGYVDKEQFQIMLATLSSDSQTDYVHDTSFHKKHRKIINLIVDD